MLPKYHIVIGAIASLISFSIFQLTLFQLAIIFFSSFLIDFDHYLLYLFKTKDFSLKKARKYFFKRRREWIALSIEERKKYKRPIFIFHGMECWLLLAALATYIHSLFWFVLIGIAIHILLDYIEYIYIGDPLYGKTSQLYVYLTNKNKKAFF